MIPTKESPGFPGGGLELDLTVDSDAALLQQRMLVAKLSREEVEDRYLRLLEENTLLKKHACKQEEKIKKLATKLIRVISEKKRMEVASGGPGKIRDIETEELIEDQQQRIRELDQENKGLKEKLLVAKNQLVGTSRPASRRSPARRPLPPRAPSHMSQVGETLLLNNTLPFEVCHDNDNVNKCQVAAPSPAPSPAPHPGDRHQVAQINQKAMGLLEEARHENRMLEEAVTTLKEQVNIYEQEVDQIKEQARIKESNFEEEISILKTQLSQSQKQTVTENIELIRLQRENKIRTAENQSLKAQIQAVEENLHKVKIQEDTARRDADDMLRQLQDEQRRAASLSQEVTSSSSSRLALQQAQEKITDLTNDNAILREANEKLLNSAFDIEKERKFMATENALKVQISQLETTLKSDLNDKRRLTDALAAERENYAQLESDFNDLQSKFLTMKQDIEDQEDKLHSFSKDNAVDQKELEEALMYLKEKKDLQPSPRKPLPSFIDQINGNHDDDARKELSELQVHFIEATNEIEKMRNLLRVQVNINNEQKKEISILQKRLGTTKQDFQDQLIEYQKLMEIRAAKIQKLEVQLRESTLGSLQKTFNSSHVELGQMHGPATTVHTASGQSLFEIHVQKVTLSQDILLLIGIPEPRLFVSWLFYDSDQSYTPVLPGPVAVFDSSSYYKIKLDDSFMEFLSDHEVIFQVHVAINNDCQTVAAAVIKFAEILDYPQNKLHGNVNLNGVKGSSKDTQVGSMDYWFKLHTHDIGKINNFLERRDNREKVSKVPVLFEQNVSFLQGERKKLTRNKKIQDDFTPLDVDPTPAQPSKQSKDKIKQQAKDKVKPKTVARKPGHLQKFPTKDRPKPPRLSKVRIEDPSTEQDSETSVSASRVHTSLSQDCVTGLDNIIKQREVANKKDKNSEKDATDKESKSGAVILQKSGETDVKMDSPKKRRSILKSLSGKHVKSEESTILINDKETKIELEEPNIKVPNETTWDTSESQSEVTPEKNNVMEETSSKESSSKQVTNDNVEDSEEEDAEDETESEEEESEECSDEESEEESEESGEEETEASEDEDVTTTEATTRGDTSAATTTSEAKPSKVIVTPDVHNGLDASNDSHDSEGVVTKKSPAKKISSLPSKDNIIILVSDFEAAQDAPFISNDQVSLLYVEYSFLDVPPEDLETPFSLPKPGANEKITFNFRKAFNVDRADNSDRRRLVSKMLRSEDDQVRRLRFKLVSEPPDSEPDLDCEDLGVAEIDLGIIDRSGQDLREQKLDVRDIDNTNICLGTLTVTIEASQAFRSIRA